MERTIAARASRAVCGTVSRGLVALALVVPLLAVVLDAAAGAAPVTAWVSLTDADGEAAGNSREPAVSADGNIVVFRSSAADLVAGDTLGHDDVFVRNRAAGTTVRASVADDESEANNASTGAAVSDDGRYVAFSSTASNLIGVGADTNALNDVFVRDLLLNTTVRVSVTDAELQAVGESLRPSISSDGRYVAFYSTAALVLDDAHAGADIYVRDRTAGTTALVSVATDGTQADLGTTSDRPVITADGRFVTFESTATTLVSGDTNGFTDVFLRDTQAPVSTVRVSVATDGTQGNGASVRSDLSSDGRYVTYESAASSLVSGDGNGFSDAFVRDVQTSTTERVSVTSAGAEATGGASARPTISGQGRFVAFRSGATNLVSGDNNGFDDIFVRDRQEGTTVRSSVATGGTQADNGNSNPRYSTNGCTVAFESAATNLAGGEANTDDDIFAREDTAVCDNGITPTTTTTTVPATTTTTFPATTTTTVPPTTTTTVAPTTTTTVPPTTTTTILPVPTTITLPPLPLGTTTTTTAPPASPGSSDARAVEDKGRPPLVEVELSRETRGGSGSNGGEEASDEAIGSAAEWLWASPPPLVALAVLSLFGGIGVLAFLGGGLGIFLFPFWRRRRRGDEEDGEEDGGAGRERTE